MLDDNNLNPTTDEVEATEEVTEETPVEETPVEATEEVTEETPAEESAE
jgi:hypothetical protein